MVLPLGLMLLEDLALGVVADDFDIGEAAQVQALCTELSHGNFKRGGRLLEDNRIRISALLWRAGRLRGQGMAAFLRLIGIGAPAVSQP